MKHLLLGALVIFILCGCGRQAPAPVAATAPAVKPPVPQFQIRPAKFIKSNANKNPGGTNESAWEIKIAWVPLDKIEAAGLQQLFSIPGDKNTVTRDELARSPFLQMARDNTNVVLNLRSGVYPGIVSAETASNLVDRLQRTGLDIMTTPPMLVRSGNEARVVVQDSLTLVISGPNGAPMTTNVSVGHNFLLRVQPFGPNTLRLEAAIRMELFTGYARDQKNPPATTFDIVAFGTRTELRANEVLVLGGPMQSTLRRTIERVPYLSEIPTLGRLFTKTELETNFFRAVAILRPLKK